jgi:thiol-disulfide isomerase/thioredoxin
MPRSRCLPVVSLMLAVGLMPVLSTARARAEDPAPAEPAKRMSRQAIYDNQADGNKQIAEALKKAKADNKRVLLMFGANWCGWCYKLHDLFAADAEIGKTLLYEYELVMIDVDRMADGGKHNADVDERYGNPTKEGLPVLVVLDAEGKRLHVQETGSLEEGDKHDPAKVLAFLKQWKPEAQSADAVLSASLAAARSGNKKVFVQFSAPWCSWCHRLSDFLADPAVAGVFGKAYVPLKIDVDRMTGAAAIDARYRGETAAAAGLPFFVVLDAGGQKLADSVGEKGNVGFPVETFEVAHFMKVLRATSGLVEEDVKTIETQLQKAGKKAGT